MQRLFQSLLFVVISVVCVTATFSKVQAAALSGVSCPSVSDTFDDEVAFIGPASASGSQQLIPTDSSCATTEAFSYPLLSVSAPDLFVSLNTFSDMSAGAPMGLYLFIGADYSAVSVGGVPYNAGTVFPVTTASSFSENVQFDHGGFTYHFLLVKAAGTNTLSAFTVMDGPVPAVPTTLAATSGGGQSTTINTAFTNPLVVTVTDAGSNAVPGVTVNFTVPGSGASALLSATSGTTDVNGQVSITVTANGTAGGYNVTASSAGLADASFALSNSQGTNAISFTGPADTALTSGPVTVSATSSSGLAVAFASTTAGVCTVAGTTVTLVSTGICSITASQAGNADFVAASNVVQTFAVTPGTNIITFNGPADTDFTVGSVALSATASSGLTVSFTTTTASVCTVSGTTVTLISVGTCSITASQAGNANFIAAADVVRSFAVSGDTVITKTRAIVSNFVSRRAGRILSGTPDIASRLHRGGGFSSATSLSPLGLNGSGTLNNAKMAFSTSLRQVIGAGNARKVAQRQKLGEMMALGEQSLLAQYNTGLQPGFDVWVKGSLDHASSDNRKLDLGLLFIGAEYHLSNTTLVGVLTQFDWSDEKDTTNSFRMDGKGWMVGPYLATRLGKNLLFDGRAAYGQSSNTISPLDTYVDSFDTTRWLVAGTLTGDFNRGGWRFSPHVSVSYFKEAQKAYIDSIGNTIAAQTISLGRLTFGPEVSTSFNVGEDTVISPHIGVKGIWDFDKAQTIDLTTGLASGSDNELRASIEAGLTTQFNNGWRLAGEGHYDGIGDDNLEAYGGSLKLTVPIH